jgi:hypothetical protein
MSKEDGVKGNPRIKIEAPVDRVYAENTAGKQKSEANYQRIVDRAVNESPTPTQRK